jgi:hypothetical protein
MSLEIEVPTEPLAETEHALPAGGQGRLEMVVLVLRNARARIQGRLDAKEITDIWIAGFKAAGVAAKRGTRWTGKFSVPLPFVIEIPCPYGHRTEDRRDYAKVQLIVEDDGWLSFDPANSCERCTQEPLEEWLLNCPRCESGDDDSQWHKSAHPKGAGHWTERDRDGVVGIVGDVSPLSFVIAEFESMWALAEAKHWVEHTEEAAATDRQSWLAMWEDRSGRRVTPQREEIIKSFAEWKLKGAQRLLSRTVPKVSNTTRRREWTSEAALKWLEQARDTDGNLVVPPSTSGAAAWRAVDAIPGRPPKRFVEAAQQQRKSRLASS